MMEGTKRKQNFLGENQQSQMVLLTDVVYPLIKVTYGGSDAFRGSEEIDAEQFIAVKGFKAKGKRISTWQVEGIEELEPVRFPEIPETPEAPDNPESPESPETKETPDNPESPEAPDNPEAPESPEPPAHPKKPAKPEREKSRQQIIDEMTGQLRLFDDEI
jgi:topoisomerase-4 subunit A